MTMQTVDFTGALLRYASIGWKGFPLVRGGKVPAISGGKGVHDATCDDGQICAWGAQFPNANIGIACGEPSGIIVVDVDPRNGGFETLAKLAAKGRVLPPGPRERTGNGGRHHVFRYRAGIINSKGKLGPGIDVKTTGGYIVAAPSWTAPSKDGPGGRYVWDASPFETPVPHMPGWMLEMLAPPARPRVEHRPLPSPADAAGYRRRAIKDLHQVVRDMSRMNDARHVAPFHKACRLGKWVAHRFLSEGEVRDAILVACFQNGAAGKYGKKDIISQIDRGLRFAANDPLPPLYQHGSARGSSCRIRTGGRLQ